MERPSELADYAHRGAVTGRSSIACLDEKFRGINTTRWSSDCVLIHARCDDDDGDGVYGEDGEGAFESVETRRVARAIVDVCLDLHRFSLESGGGGLAVGVGIGSGFLDLRAGKLAGVESVARDAAARLCDLANDDGGGVRVDAAMYPLVRRSHLARVPVGVRPGGGADAKRVAAFAGYEISGRRAREDDDEFGGGGVAEGEAAEGGVVRDREKPTSGAPAAVPAFRGPLRRREEYRPGVVAAEGVSAPRSIAEMREVRAGFLRRFDACDSGARRVKTVAARREASASKKIQIAAANSRSTSTANSKATEGGDSAAMRVLTEFLSTQRLGTESGDGGASKAVFDRVIASAC